MADPSRGSDYRTRDEFAGKRGLEGPYHEYLKYLQETVGGKNPDKRPVETPQDFYNKVEGSGARAFKPEDFARMLEYMALFLKSNRGMREPDAVEKMEDPYFDKAPDKKSAIDITRGLYRMGGSGW